MIDYYLFYKNYQSFKTFVEGQVDIEFVSFAHPYTQKEEGYKDEVYKEARERLNFACWKTKEIGTGKILKSVIDAIELKSNNLVIWKDRYGAGTRLHQKMYEALGDIVLLKEVEKAFFKLYHTHDDKASFKNLVGIFGEKYSLLAYLFFIKDSTRYLPISTTAFDKSFSLLGSSHKTVGKCSWENYSVYLKTVNDVKDLLQSQLCSEANLLNAHSFIWMLVTQMKDFEVDLDNYQNLLPRDKESVVKARIGQGQYREDLIKYWGKCAVTGCSNESLLIASHIKPWKDSDLNECRDPFNGLLLSPSLDLCFDKGLVTFEDSGEIIFSSSFTESDQKCLGLNHEMRLSKIEDKHKGYLQYHRKTIFINE